MSDPESTVAVPDDPLAEGGRIVVGVDDSDTATVALRWALREAALRKATLEVVHAWQPPVTVLPFGATLPLTIDEGELDAAARSELDKVVDSAVTEVGEPTPEITRTTLPGPPAMTLIEVASDADLLVVGSHGRGGLRGLLLGSVANACVQHASCPVVVVRRIDDDNS